MQVIRLMGNPDKLIAFEGLPEELLTGLEMRGPEGLPRHWRTWLGNKKKVTNIPPERDHFTGQVRMYAPIVEEGPYFYMIDEMLNHDREKWAAISDYVKRNAPKDFRLKDKIEDMAVKMAPDVKSELKIEPEDVLVIPLSEAAITKSAPPIPDKVVSIPVTMPKSDEEIKAMQNNEYFKTISDEDIKAMSHDKNCTLQGRGGRYTDGCPKCEAFKNKKIASLVA